MSLTRIYQTLNELKPYLITANPCYFNKRNRVIALTPLWSVFLNLPEVYKLEWCYTCFKIYFWEPDGFNTFLSTRNLYAKFFNEVELNPLEQINILRDVNGYIDHDLVTRWILRDCLYEFSLEAFDKNKCLGILDVCNLQLEYWEQLYSKQGNQQWWVDKLKYVKNQLSSEIYVRLGNQVQ